MRLAHVCDVGYLSAKHDSAPFPCVTAGYASGLNFLFCQKEREEWIINSLNYSTQHGYIQGFAARAETQHTHTHTHLIRLCTLLSTEKPLLLVFAHHRRPSFLPSFPAIISTIHGLPYFSSGTAFARNRSIGS